ncbi:Ppp6r3, partial [Symbiodinium natans]
MWMSLLHLAKMTCEGGLLNLQLLLLRGLLDEEEIIQEFKTGNPRLVARLSEPDAIQALMEFITLEPRADAPCNRCFRYPFLTVELITCGPPKFLELLVNPKSCNALELLWGFLGSTAPGEVNSVLAGYFARTAAALLSKHQKEVLEYLRQRGPDQLLREFLDRIHLRSLAELFARLLCAEGEAQVVFPTQNIVAQLLEKWQECEAGGDAQENITLIIAELLSQKDVLYWIEDLTHQLTSPATVRFLIEHIFRRAGGVPPAMSLLTTVIVHTTAGIKDGMTEVCASTPTLSPLSPPSPALVAGEEDMTLDEGVVGEASTARAATLSPPSTPNTTLRSTTSEEWMERRRAALLREVASHFPRLREVLDAGLAQAAEDPSLAMPQGRICPVGGTTLEVISLIATVARSGLDVILEALLNHQLLPRCVEVFFRHPWSSLLHNSVKQLLLEVLSGTDHLRQELIRQLLKEARLAQRLASEYAAEAAWKAATVKPRHARVGYMGHLFLIACELRDYGNTKSAEVGELLSSTPGWSEVLGSINDIQGLHREQLGGGVPASDRGLASTKAPTAEPAAPPQEQFAACPSWSQRVMTGRKTYLAEEPTDLQENGGSGPQPAGAAAAGASIPNGQGSQASDEDFFVPPSAPPGLRSGLEDAFDPDGLSKVQSSSSWASFPD